MNEQGQRVDAVAYWQWRHKAVHAKNAKSRQLRAVKDRLHALRMEGRADGAERRVFVPTWPGMSRAEFLQQAGLVYDAVLRRASASTRADAPDMRDLT